MIAGERIGCLGRCKWANLSVRPGRGAEDRWHAWTRRRAPLPCHVLQAAWRSQLATCPSAAAQAAGWRASGGGRRDAAATGRRMAALIDRCSIMVPPCWRDVTMLQDGKLAGWTAD